MVFRSHFWLYLGGFMMAKVTSIYKNGYLLNLVSKNSILVTNTGVGTSWPNRKISQTVYISIKISQTVNISIFQL